MNLLGSYLIHTSALIGTLTFLCQVQIVRIDNFKLYLHYTGSIIAASYQQQICTIWDLENFQKKSSSRTQKNFGKRHFIGQIVEEVSHFISQQRGSVVQHSASNQKFLVRSPLRANIFFLHELALLPVDEFDDDPHQQCVHDRLGTPHHVNMIF